MHRNLYIIILLFGVSSYSQVRKIYVNSNNKVFLIFDSPIKHGKEGSREYIFGYNKNSPNKIGNLIAKKNANPTNLFVVTTDEKMYSFELEYKENLKPEEFTYIVNPKYAIGGGNNFLKSEKRETKKTNVKVVSKTIGHDNYDYHYHESNPDEGRYLNLSKKIALKDESYFRNQIRVIDKIYFSLKNYYYNKDELYFYFEIQNHSKLDFDINFIKFFTTTKKRKNRTISQQIFLGQNGSPMLTYNLPKRIKKGQKINFVCVFKKFSLNKNKSLLINLSELKGERVLELDILSKIINNPQIF
ncbi:protein of unknown function [Tenacibaculum sp. MAR_2009_124]|uniref:DUF4138 domain-containing protein n=1 Tax=Tenacibaculum sp. MAR_2009_124 TaxID=1250059 RepID=UPI00089A924E|nr:DUF4138 domain-containing protein [Tenacibaculum sp. MAR_2009_124]SEC65594.1 protein of unknown function [Tenacibaculum sp. MAR_2009_124]